MGSHIPKRPAWDLEQLRTELLSERIVTSTNCWVRASAVKRQHPDWYDYLKIAGRNVGVHVVALWIWKGVPPIHGGPQAGVTMHTCDNPPCWNPDHLVRSTQHANVRDQMDKGHRLPRWSRTHCPSGHPFLPDTTYLHGRHRQCLICKCQHKAAFDERRKAKEACL